jgi:hypothetical protein
VGGTCSTYGEGNRIYRVSVGSPKGKRPLGRPRRRCEDNVRKIMIDEANWIQLAQNRFQWAAFVNTVINLQVP